jgi:hypothetical protein
MPQTHSMILWAAPTKEDFKETVNKAYQILTALKEFGPELSPNYITNLIKKDAKQFSLDYDSLAELIRKGVNKEGNRVFPDLGYRINFFSSLNDVDNTGISLTLGVTNSKLKNTFIVNFPISLNVFDDNISIGLIELFKTCNNIFNPFWGCILNSGTLIRYKTLFKNDLATTIHWVNFWGEDIIRKVSEEKISKASLYSREKIDNKGYLLILKRKPIDDNSQNDIRIQNETNKSLGLTE